MKQRWQYRKEMDLPIEKLNEAGAEGWELVNCLMTLAGIPLYFFKRPLTIEDLQAEPAKTAILPTAAKAAAQNRRGR